MTRISLPLLLCLAVLTPLARAAAPSVLIQTQAAQQGSLPVTVTAYGSVVPARGALTTLSAPRAGLVQSVDVVAGQLVRKGQILYRYATDPATRAAWLQARSALAYARQEVVRTRRMQSEGLATQGQVAAALKAEQDAQAALAAQRALGANQASEALRAPYDGVVTQLSATPGDRLQPGAPILALARTGRYAVHLGIEPEDALQLRPGMAVTLRSVFGDMPPIRARIASIQGLVDPQTRLVNATVDLPAARGLLPGMQVTARIVLRDERGWQVPRQAVLQDGAGRYLFQVSGGHARRIAVQELAQGGTQAIVRGALAPNLPVVVLGNYELKDGMAVREHGQ